MLDPGSFYMFKSYLYGTFRPGDEVEIKIDGEVTTGVIFGFYRTSALTTDGRRLC